MFVCAEFPPTKTVKCKYVGAKSKRMSSIDNEKQQDDEVKDEAAAPLEDVEIAEADVGAQAAADNHAQEDHDLLPPGLALGWKFMSCI